MKHGDLAFNQVYFVVHFVLQPVEAVSSLLDIPAHFYGDMQKLSKILA